MICSRAIDPRALAPVSAMVLHADAKVQGPVGPQGSLETMAAIVGGHSLSRWAKG
jgi:hypothetical protein